MLYKMYARSMICKGLLYKAWRDITKRMLAGFRILNKSLENTPMQPSLKSGLTYWNTSINKAEIRFPLISNIWRGYGTV